MAQDRNDRLLMRQRGAGSHKIKDVDFGLSFPLPAHLQLAAPRASTSSRPSRASLPSEQGLRSSSVEQATPKHALQRRRSESTIVDTSRLSEAASNTRHAQSAEGAGLDSELHEPEVSSGAGQITANRPDVGYAAPSPGETPSLKLKRKRGVSPYYGIPAAEHKPPDEDPDLASDELAEPYTPSQPGTGRRMGRSQDWYARSARPGDPLSQKGQYLQSPTVRRSTIGRRSNATDRTQSWTNDQARLSGMQSTIDPSLPGNDTNIERAQDDDIFSEVHEPFSRASSIVRASSIADEYLKVRDDVDPEDEDEADVLGQDEQVIDDQEQEEPEEQEQQEESGDEDEIGLSTPSSVSRAASVLSSRASSVARSLPGSRQGSQVPQGTLPAPRLLIRSKAAPPPAAGSPMMDSRRKPPSAPPRPPKQQRRPDSSAALRLQAARNVRRRKGAQVLVYRLNNTQVEANGSDTKDGERSANGDDGEEEDVLQTAPKFIRRPGVNAVDVLNQLFRELIDAQVENLQETPPPAPSNERDDEDEAEDEDEDEKEYRVRQHKALTKRKIKAIELFADELKERNFQLTECLDANHALSIRVRQALREKQALRERLIHLRRQRDEIAQKIDDVKSSTYDKTAAANKHEFLNGGLQDVELAVKRGRLRAAGTGTGAGKRAAKKDGPDEEAENIELWLMKFAPDLTTTSTSTTITADSPQLTTSLEATAPTQAQGDPPTDQAPTHEGREGEQEAPGSQATGISHETGGILQRVKEFNTFLERSLAFL